MRALPPNWVWARVGDLVELGPKNQADDEIDAGFVPLQRMGINYRSHHSLEVRPWGTIKKGYTHFMDGDVLLARITPSFENGKGGIVRGLPNGIGSGSTEYYVCRPIRNTLLPEYLLAHFKTPRFLRDGEQVMSGAVGQQRVPKQYLLDSQLPLPPLNEQKRIADKLDAVLARVDACRERLDHVPAILKRFRQSIIAAATSSDIQTDLEGNERPQPRSAFRPLADVIEEFVTGPFGSALHKSDYVVGGIPLVNPMHINRGVITPSAEMAVSPAKARELSQFALREGDVVIARRGVMGRCAVVALEQGGWLCGTGSMVLRPKAALDSQYLQMFLSSPATVAMLEADAVGSTMVNLNQRILLALRIALPSLGKQQAIVRQVKALFAYADRLEARYAAARAQVERLTSALLGKAFRGELVPQDPNDQPASVLLERIRAMRAAATPKPRSRQGAGRQTKTQKVQVTRTPVPQTTPPKTSAT